MLQLAFKTCPHHLGHWLGMDVHDTPSISRNTKLQPNQVICVEPGECVLAISYTLHIHMSALEDTELTVNTNCLDL